MIGRRLCGHRVRDRLGSFDGLSYLEVSSRSCIEDGIVFPSFDLPTLSSAVHVSMRIDIEAEMVIVGLQERD